MSSLGSIFYYVKAISLFDDFELQLANDVEVPFLFFFVLTKLMYQLKQSYAFSVESILSSKRPQCLSSWNNQTPMLNEELIRE